MHRDDAQRREHQLRHVRGVSGNDAAGQVFALFSIAIAAAEVAVGLAILLNLQKTQDTIGLEEINLLRW